MSGLGRRRDAFLVLAALLRGVDVQRQPPDLAGRLAVVADA